TSEVLEATSRTICAPMFSNLSSSSISLATVTPSLVTRGAPKLLSSTTLRPLGPSVTFTALLRMTTPRSILSRASTEHLTSLGAMAVVSEMMVGGRADAVASGGLLAGDALFDDAHDVALLHDQELFAVDLDLGARPFAEQHPVADLDVDGDQLAGLVAAAGANRGDLALGGLFLGGVGNDDAAGGLLFGIDALDGNAVVKRTKLHDVLLKLLTEFKVWVGGPEERASLSRSFQARHRGHFLGPQEAPKKDLALADWECQAKSGTRLIRVPPSTLRPRAGEDPPARLSALLSQCC